jgi:3-oxoacid CoA-transferase subunit B
VVTDLAVIDVRQEGMVLREVAPEWTAEEVQERTGVKLIVRGQVGEMKLG